MGQLVLQAFVLMRACPCMITVHGFIISKSLCKPAPLAVAQPGTDLIPSSEPPSLSYAVPGKACHPASPQTGPVTYFWSLHLQSNGFHICVGHLWLEIC